MGAPGAYPVAFFWRCQPKRFFPAGQDFKKPKCLGVLNKGVAVFFCHFGAKRFLPKAKARSASPWLAICL